MAVRFSSCNALVVSMPGINLRILNFYVTSQEKILDLKM